MNVIALLPTRNEAWVLPHSLACLSGFCDVIIVNDQNSEDNSREICRTFPKVVLLEQSESVICGKARWQLWDAARNYDGNNLLWCTDPDELMSPRHAAAFIARQRESLVPGTAVECLFYHPWGRPDRYRNDLSSYKPHWKPLAAVDDRRMDYNRDLSLPLHEYRVPFGAGTPVVQADDFPVLHLQWLLAQHNQMKQAWYRCLELVNGEKTAVAVNEFYRESFPVPHARTTAIPREWVDDVTFPDAALDQQQSWQEREILKLFDERGVEFFERLEIWHVAKLGDEFRKRMRRNPRPDRSYRGPWSRRAREAGRRWLGAAWRLCTS